MYLCFAFFIRFCVKESLSLQFNPKPFFISNIGSALPTEALGVGRVNLWLASALLRRSGYAKAMQAMQPPAFKVQVSRH